MRYIYKVFMFLHSRMGQTGLLFRFEKDAEKKAADEKRLFGETMPKIFGLWESRLTHKFLTDDKVTRM